MKMDESGEHRKLQLQELRGNSQWCLWESKNLQGKDEGFSRQDDL